MTETETGDGSIWKKKYRGGDSESDDEEHHLPPKSSIKRWLVTTNHKDIGILYTVTALFFLIMGGVLALLIRLQMLSGGNPISGFAYNQTVSAHGLIMVFFFLSPFAFGFANYVVPLQIGAKDLAFPRLNALSYWLYLFAGVLFGVSFFQGGTFAGGWTAYAPLSVPAYMPQVGATTAVLAMVTFIGAVTVSSVNFLTTIHKMRAEDMRLRDLPMFSYSILVTVWMMLFAFAALLAAFVILGADHILGTTYFSTTVGGTASMLWAHLFWFFGHPEVYIVFFPALGAMAEMFQTFSNKRLLGRKWIMAAMALVGAQSFLVWMHHMFLTGINLETQTVFMATTIAISLPFDLMVFSLIYTMLKGRVEFKTPFLFSLGALLLFIVGGITGVFLGAIPLDYQFRGTYWVVAHFHYVMFGGSAALFGALYYWFPKMTGKMYNEFLGKVNFALFFVGFNLLYFPLFVAWETPRRVFEYAQNLVTWHQLASIGGVITAVSFLVMFINLVYSLRKGDEAPDNPWQGSTIEWGVPSPPPIENFPGIPSFREGKLKFVRTVSGGAEDATADGGKKTQSGIEILDVETDGGAAIGGGHEGKESHASIWPFAISLTAAVLFIGVSGISNTAEGLKIAAPFYPPLAVIGAVGFGLSLLGLVREEFYGPVMEVAESWPFEGVENTKLGMWIFLGSDIVLFGSFIGSYLFARVAYGWNAWHHDLIPEAHKTLPGLINTYLLLTSSFAVVLAMVAAEKGSKKGVIASLSATIVLGLGFLGNKAVEWIHLFNLHHGKFAGGWELTTNIASSTFYLTTGLHGAHVIIGLVIAGYMLARALKGAYLGNDEPIEYFGLYWHFVDIVWLFLFPLFYIL